MENILVCIAWPYANADIHQGNVTGSHLPGDIYARFHRLKGNNVLMVSGSDTHGTPVTIRAEEEGRPITEVYEDFHGRFLETFQKLGINYDLYTHTDTENHHQVAQDVFSNLRKHEYLYRQVSEQMYSPSAEKFLPDRLVEGTCPNCGFEGARGDQCDNCNTLFDSASELLNPRSKIGNQELILKETEHFYIDLPALAENGLEAWLDNDKEHWRNHVINFSRAYLKEGLVGRAITRDMDWGILIPEAGHDLPGHEKKVMYVWFEAVIGYLSATIEWAKNNGTPDAWKDWWYDANARIVNFLGKDNITFHTVIWPAELKGLSGLYSENENAKLNLPYDVPANEFMNMEGHKISGSRNWGVWVNEALDRHDPDPFRYYLTVTMPETRDSDWSWQGYVDRNNTELVANWGNLVNRVLSMTKRYFKGNVPEAGELTEGDKALIAEVDAGFESVAALYDACKFRAAVQEIMRISTKVNQYMEEMSPWTTAKTDMARTGTTLYVALQALSGLKTLFAPVLPFTSQRLHEMLGEDGTLFGEAKVEAYAEKMRNHLGLTYDGDAAIGTWARSLIPTGRVLPKPKPLFKKLDDSVVEDEIGRLGDPPL